MKTQKEIVQLANEEYKDNLNNPFFTAAPMGYIKGYTQCQEDMQKEIEYWQGEFDHWHQQAMEMADKKYTEADIRKAINVGISAEAGDYPDGWSFKLGISLEDYFINSLNKQD